MIFLIILENTINEEKYYLLEVSGGPVNQVVTGCEVIGSSGRGEEREEKRERITFLLIIRLNRVTYYL